MALIGITLGVVSIVSVHLISSSISTRLNGLVPAQLASYTHFLHRDDISANDYFEWRRNLGRGELTDIDSLAPLIDETTDIDGLSVRVIGVDLFDASLIPEARLAASTSENSSTVDEFSWTGIWIDESLVGHIDRPLNGIVEAPAGTLFADIGPAQELLGWSDTQLSYLGLKINDPLAETIDLLENLLPGFGAGFPSRPPELALPEGWRVVTIAQQHPAREFGKSVLFNISALGLLALLVAWLLIYQVSVSWLRRLWPVFDRLHVLGVDWAVLRRYFLGGLLGLAIVSSVLGLLLGLFLAQWLLDAAMPVESIQLQLDSWVVLKAAGSSITVCLLGGLLAFHRAEQMPGLQLVTTAVSLVMLLVAAYCVFVPDTGLAGGFLSIAVLSLVSGFVVSPMLRRLKQVSRLIRGPYLARLSVREAIWYPEDVGVALAGLILAVATAIGVGLMIESFRADFSAMLERRLDYDLVAEGQHETLVEVAQQLTANSSVTTRIQGYRDAEIRITGFPVTLRVARVDRQEAGRYGEFSALTANQALLSEQAAKVLQVSVGDVIVASGHEIEVSGIFSGFGDIQPRLIVDVASPLADAADQLDSIGIKSVQPAVLLSQLRKDFPDLSLRLQTDIRRVAMDTFDQTFAITTVLISIALLVATISIYIAITSMRLNRATGSRLLTTLGINRLESVGMDFALGMGVGAVALMLALPLGVIFGWILCTVINPRAFGWTIELQLSVGAILPPLLLGLAAAVVAGLLRGGRSEEGFAHAQR